MSKKEKNSNKTRYYHARIREINAITKKIEVLGWRLHKTIGYGCPFGRRRKRWEFVALQKTLKIKEFYNRSTDIYNELDAIKASYKPHRKRLLYAQQRVRRAIIYFIVSNGLEPKTGMVELKPAIRLYQHMNFAQAVAIFCNFTRA